MLEGESTLWRLFPLSRIHEVSAQIEMKDHWGNFANTWNSNFSFALVNYDMVKEERRIVKRLCYFKWHNHSSVLTIGMCQSSSGHSKFTELLKCFSLMPQTKRHNISLKAEENFVYLPQINDMRGCVPASRYDAIVSHGKQLLTTAGLLGFTNPMLLSIDFWMQGNYRDVKVQPYAS